MWKLLKEAEFVTEKPPSMANGLMEVPESPLCWSTVDCTFLNVISNTLFLLQPNKVYSLVEILEEMEMKTQMSSLRRQISFSLINNMCMYLNEVISNTEDHTFPEEFLPLTLNWRESFSLIQ